MAARTRMERRIRLDRLHPVRRPAAGDKSAFGPLCRRQQQDRARGLPLFLGRGWDLPNRALRIAALLDKTPRQSPTTSAAIQPDTFSLMAAQLVPLMRRIAPRTAAERAALARLRRWDFHMDRDKVAPLLFTAYLRAFSRMVLFGRFGRAIAPYWDLKPQVMETVLTRRPDWCARPNPAGSAPGRGCARLLRAALDRALAALSRAYGPDIAGWRWGRA